MCFMESHKKELHFSEKKMQEDQKLKKELTALNPVKIKHALRTTA